MKKQIAILGSTGSIGTQALEVVSEHPDLFEIYALTAYNNATLLIQQARAFGPDVVVIGNEALYPDVSKALSDLPIKVYAGIDAVLQVVEADPIDVVLTAMVGYAGLCPTLRAIKAKKMIALANKETLVVAGDLVKRLALENSTPIIPVDSEHSAIFQCLVGEAGNPIDKIILTASGGPFRTTSLDDLRSVTKNEALRHPKWRMGAKITIDSATMMNKGFEAIEAKWLFDLRPEQIEIAVHPQSIVHSMVQYCDGAVKAQLGVPDMKLPIGYAFSFPERLCGSTRKLRLEDYAHLTFEAPDVRRFPSLQLAYRAMDKGGNAPCVLNAANEVVVDAFLHDRIGFLQMSDVVSDCLEKIAYISSPAYEDYVQTDAETRRVAASLIR